jgi:hypothetical protein
MTSHDHLLPISMRRSERASAFFAIGETSDKKGCPILPEQFEINSFSASVIRH